MSRVFYRAERAPELGLAAVTVLFAAACVAFVWQPVLASFADDSVSYLVMAKVFSPWASASEPVREAFVREAFYPPLFPLLLALAGGAERLAWAHALTALMLAASLPVLYLLAVRWLGGRWSALGVVLAAALAPSLWIHVKGILSEPLFLFFLLLSLLAAGERRARLLALALSGLVLTRTVGVVVALAFASHALTRRGLSWRQRAAAAWPAAAALAASACWAFLRPAATPEHYLGIIAERGHALVAGGHVLAALQASLERQAAAIGQAWVGALMIFWVVGRAVPVVLASIVGILALAGLGLRLREGKPDAWMAAAYVGTFLLWPFDDQMTRFLFPAVPALLLYAFFTASRLPRPRAALALLFLLVASLCVPALAFMRQRSEAGAPYAWMTDWYRTPDLDNARRRSRTHLELLADMEEIREVCAPSDRVMWVAPSYIALLADRRGVPAPDADLPLARYREAVLAAQPQYVLLTAYHPRDTIHDTAWQTGVAALNGQGEIVRARAGDGGVVSSLLIRLGSR
ncbi:MAG TPA: hypothetical protein VFB08_05605 [Burkholderiales bacterium]|nr:hypothetical protein [Burkholderiales bacterium]